MSIFYNIKQAVSKFTHTILPLDYLIKKRSNRYILAYHRILPAGYIRQHHIQSAMWVDEYTFSQQLYWFSKIGRIVSLDEITDFSSRNDEPLFCITFDDGWIDNYQYAFPILKQYNAPATVFLATQSIEAQKNFWVEELFTCFEYGINQGKSRAINDLITSSEFNINSNVLWTLIEDFVECIKPLTLEERKLYISKVEDVVEAKHGSFECQLMNWEHIKDMKNGGIDFQSHTHSHHILLYATDEEIVNELTLSKKIIDENLSINCETFCYPNARFPLNKDYLYKKSGYKKAVKIDDKVVDKSCPNFYLPRFLMSQDRSGEMGYLKFRFLNVPYY